MSDLKMLAATVAPGGLIVVKEVDVPKPGPGEILVKVEAAAQNPTDWRIVKGLAKVGAVVGHDFAGVVENLGPDVPEGLRTLGERVAGFTRGGISANGAFSQYVVASAKFGVVHLPDSWTFEDGAQLGVAPFTALQMLYQSHTFPKPPAVVSPSVPLLVSGAASSVGQWAVQLAKISGLYVVATASQKNAALVKSLGADEVYDYNDPEVGQKIKASTKGALKHAVDTISEGKTPQLVFDAFSEEGGVVAAILPYATPPRDNIKVVNSFAFDNLGKSYDLPRKHVATPEANERVYGHAKLLEQLIADGKLKPNPVNVIPGGLAGVSDGFQYMLEGKVSGQKITYRIADTPKQS
ncbi:dehydrogenase [Auriscalpium vulgare]|uniref:Dehydrogenase n=1 Tax=Auriscalpium vulgare TaxID=40419 RepID=A0ACB8RTZ6_9AGAM|nr:dehydrogenase [Auriscalpium vulgare]